MVKKIVHPQKPRLNFRTVLLVIAPSAILLIGSWLSGVATVILSENPFQPSLPIIFGGLAIAVTAALLVAVFALNRTNVPTSDSAGLPSFEE